MPDCLGVDIGSEWLTLAVVGREKRRTVLRSFNRFEYGSLATDAAGRAQFAASAVAESSHAKLPIAISVSGAEVFLRVLSVPFTKPAMIAKTLKFEMEGRLPFDVDDAVMDFTIVETGDKSSNLLVAAMPRSFVEATTGPFEAAGLNVRMLTADVLNVASLASVSDQADGAFLDVGQSSWKFAECQRGSLVFARAAAAAGASGNLETALAAWIKQGMMAAPAAARLERVTLMGEISAAVDTATLRGLLGVPVAEPALAGLDSDDSLVRERDTISKKGAWAVAAANAAVSGQGVFDFYGAAFGKQGPLERLFAPVALALVAGTLIFAALSTGLAMKLIAANGRIADISAQESELWKQYFGDEAAPGGVHAAIAAKMRSMDENSVEKALGAQPPAMMRAVYELSKALNPGEGVEILRLAMRDGKPSVAAYAPNDATAEQLARNITAGGVFDAKVETFRNEDSRVYFEVVMKPSGASNVR